MATHIMCAKLTWLFAARYTDMHMYIAKVLACNNLIAFQNLGPVWKVLFCLRMGTDIPASAVSNILEEQSVWEKKRVKRSDKEYIHKR